MIDIISKRNPKPNKFTIAIGRQIKIARADANLSQIELAERLYCRRATLSDIETGKADIDAVTIAHLAYTLQKPLSFFFPAPFFPDFSNGEISTIESELIILFRTLSDMDQKKIIAQIKAITQLS